MKQRVAAIALAMLISWAASAPLAAARTEVTIRSQPPGATVTEDQLGVLGTTDLSIKLKRKSTIHLVLSKKGYQERRVESRVLGRSMELSVVLEKIPETSVEVTVDPPHARYRLVEGDGNVLIEGKGGDVRPLPVELFGERDSVELRIQVFAPGHAATAAQVAIEKGRHQALSYVLAELSTVLAVRSDPPGARVDEQSLGYLGTTPFEASLSASDLIRSGRTLGSGDTVELVLTFSKRGFRGVEMLEVVDFARPSNPIRVRLEPSLGGSGYD